MKKNLFFFITLLLSVGMLTAQQIQPSAIRQINSLAREKESRTPAQKKMDSQLWYALKMERGEAITSDVASLQVSVRKASNGKAPVEIKGTITQALLDAIKNSGGDIIFSSEKFQSVTANIPLVNLEQIAALQEVKFIGQSLPPRLVGKGNDFVNNTVGMSTITSTTPLKIKTTTFEERKNNLKHQLSKALQFKPFTGAVTSEGDVTHKANLARTTFGVNGAGIKIGVISDSYNATGGAAANVTSGDLPGTGNPNGYTTPVTVLQDFAGGSDEGRAMLQIVHDLAPGAQLFFATADVGGQAGFAQAILNLRAAGCDIICDDVFYYAEGVFQDGVVAQAVNTVTASGALYFSSAGNQGNKDANTSTVWEGDFVDGGAIALITGGTVNDFGGGTLNNQILSNGGVLKLTWSDPLGASTNDYDLYVLNAGLTAVVTAGTTIQSGTQDPMELINGQAAGNRVVIFKKTSAVARALHLNGFNEGTNGFAVTTQGQTSGHSSSAAAFSVAATPAAANPFGGPAGPFPGPFVATNVVQTFSSDGPRRVFLNADGTAITPGNFLFATNGGTVRQKPDITAANGVATSGFTAASGLNPFFGTSAAAPHAAAIAALLKQYTPGITPTQVRTILTTTAIDIQAPGVDRDAGAGIVMALEALQGSCVPGFTGQPVSTTVCAGTTASFNVIVTGATPITYQWQVSADNGVTWTNIATATTTTYSFNAVAGDNGKQFRCVATGTCGNATSNAATLTITTLSQGGTISPATSVACAGTNSTTLTLNGYIGNIIRWESSINGGTTWTNIANTAATLTATNTTQTTQYRVLVQSSGCSAAYSVVGTINFVAPGIGPLTITANQGTTLCAGDPTLLTAMGLTTNTFSNTGAILVPATGTSGIAGPYPSNITVSGLPTTGVSVKSVTLTNINHTWSADMSILLQSPTGQNVILMSNVGGTSGITNRTYTFDDAAATGLAAASPSGTYKPTNNSTTRNWPAPGPGVVVQGTNPLLSSFTGNVNGTWKLYAFDNAAGDAGNINGGYSITFASTGIIPGLTYTWSPASGLNNTTGNPVAASPAVSTTYTVNATSAAGCTSSASVAITVNARPSVTLQPLPLIVCEKGNATFTAAGAGTGISLQWQESTNGGTTYTNINNGGIYSGATTGTLTITGVTAAMNNNLYRLVVAGTCTPIANSNGAKLTVNPAPAVVVNPTSACGGIAGTNGTLLTATGASSYTWSPVAGLYTNTTATTAYTGSSTATVYAAPTVFTAYTVTGTNAATGCTNTATASINYTPTAPIINPSPANLCIADSIIMLTKAQPKTLSFTSGTINVPIIDNDITGGKNSISVSGIPAGAFITGVVVKMNATHTWAGDLVIGLKAPNNQILNLDYYLTQTDNGTGVLSPAFANTLVSSAGGASFGSGTQPFTGTFKADAQVTPLFATAPTGPTGFDATTNKWGDLYSTPNGNWTLAWADAFGGGDVGNFTDWSIDITYQVGTPSTSPVWTPVAGLYTNAAATIPYVAGTPRDTVWAKIPQTPLPGSYNYQVTANSLPSAGASIGAAATNFPDNNGFGLVTFNVKNNNAYDVMLTDISSVVLFNDAHDVTAFYKPSPINGAPGAINTANGWTQFGSGSITGTGLVQPFMSGLGLVIPAGATYGIAVQADEVGFGADIDYSTLAAGTYTFTTGGCSIITGSNIGYGGDLAPAAPANTPRGFIGSVTFANVAVPCTSPSRIVTVTINDSVKIVSQPVNASACMDKAASFTVKATGTDLTYQWQVRTPTSTSFSNVSNGGVYSGANQATLVITAPPASMNGYQYQCVISGASPCGGKTTNIVVLTVNGFPVVSIDASLYHKLFPGLRTTVFSTVGTPGGTYTWFRNGTIVQGASGNSLVVNIDQLGTYKVQYTDLNGCTSTSNLVSITDSTSGKVFIYPSPNAGQFQVRYNNTANGTNFPRGLNVYDAQGKRVLTQTYPVGVPYARMDVDLRNLSTGVYWVEVVDASGNRLAIGRTEVLR